MWLSLLMPSWIIPADAVAVFTVGNELYEYCTADKAKTYYIEQAARCLSYIASIADSSTCELSPPGFGWRPDSGITISQLQKVVVAFLIAHPEQLHFAANALIQESLAKAFPCK